MALEILSVRISSQGPNPKRDRLHRWIGCFRKDEPSRFVIRIRLSVRLFNGGQSSALTAPGKGAQRRKSGPRAFIPQGRLQGSWRRKGSLSTTSSNEGSSSFNSRALDMFYCNDSEFHREARKRWATPKLFETVAMESTSDALRFSSSSQEDEEDDETDRDRTLANKSRKSGRWRVDDYAVAVPTSDDVTTDLLLKTINFPLPPPGCQKEVGRRSDHDDGSDSSSFLPSQFGESPTFSEVVPKKISLTPFRPPSLKRNMKNGKTKVYHKKKLFAAAKKRRSGSRGASTSALGSSLENRPSPSKKRVSSGYLGSATPEHATGESQTSKVASPLKSRPNSSKKRVSWGYVRSTTPEQASGVVSPLENRPSPAKKRDSSGNVGPATPEDVTGKSQVSRDVSPLKSRPNPSKKGVSSGNLGSATPEHVTGESQVSKDVSPLKNQPSPSKQSVSSGNLGSATPERVTGESRVSRVASPLKNRPSSSKKSVSSGNLGSATPEHATRESQTSKVASPLKSRPSSSKKSVTSGSVGSATPMAEESEPSRVASPLKNGPSSSKRRGVSWAHARSTTPAPSTSAKDSARKRKSGEDANSGGGSGHSSVNGAVVLEDGQKGQQEQQENHLSISRKLNFVTDEQDGTRGRSRGLLHSPLATPLPAIQECEDQAQVSQPLEQVENSTISTKKKAKRRTRLTEPKPKARNSKRSASITRDSNSMPDDTMNTTGLRRSGRERRPPKPEVYRCFIVVNSARRLKSFNHELGINEANEAATFSVQNASSVTNRASVSRASTTIAGRKRSQTVSDPDNLATPPANKRRTTTAKKQATDSTITDGDAKQSKRTKKGQKTLSKVSKEKGPPPPPTTLQDDHSDESPKKTGRAKKGEKPSKRVSTVTSIKNNPPPPPPLPSQDDDSDRGAKRTRRTRKTEKTLDNVPNITSVEKDPSPPILQDDDSGMVDNGTMSGTSCAATFAQPPEPSTSKGFRKTRKAARTTARSSHLTNTNEDSHANGDCDNIPDPHAPCDGLFEKKNSMAYEPLNDDNRHLLTGKSDLMENLNHVLILPGGEKPLHRTVKSSLGFVVMSGNALVQVGDKYSYVSTEDRFKVPIGEKYMIKNLSDEEPLKLLCIKV
ncbi:unnamed protein product [Callosobruchus maculatus]|uniref:Mif2/CENP-C cupin domain-containing protein n=1 Tax=Callosobruchus maculatus TaxID=64391 RepID=A0A653CF87_CALMS|nr:unnamed protein product [Callosobruchus maculatus]